MENSIPTLEMNDEGDMIFLTYSQSLNFLEDIEENRKCECQKPALLSGFEPGSAQPSAYSNLLDMWDSDIV
jgi:hypothetical protein